jgi:transcriptional regulator with XRE-family HTH domain
MTRGKAGKAKSALSVKFGKRLAALRNAQKWSLTYMEQHSGLSESFLYEMEHGIKEPCLNTLDILAKSFDMSMSELLKSV